jgi:hypothetical protein
MDPEIGGDLLDRHTVITAANNPDDVVTELSGVGLGHRNILPAGPSGASQLRCDLFVQHTRMARWIEEAGFALPPNPESTGTRPQIR